MAQNPTPWRELRESAGLKLREAARRADINPGTLSAIERGFTPEQEQRLRKVLFEAIYAKGERT